MAELARPVAYGVNPQVFNPQPLQIGPFAIDQRQNAKAALLGSIATALGELPGKLLESYVEGKKLGTGEGVRRTYEQVLAGKGPKNLGLSDFTVDSSGKILMNPEDPILRAAKLKAVEGKSGVLFNQLDQQLKGGTLPLSGSTTSGGAVGAGIADGTVFGLVPDGQGGWKDDPNDKTDANVPGFSATTGKYGHNIKDPSLAGVALGPAQLKAAGINPDNADQVSSVRVKVTGPDGRTGVYPIVDLLGTPGKVDLTAKAYTEMGGPMTRNGGTIPGIKYQIVPADASSAVSLDRQAQIQNAATQTGMQLANIPPEALSAENVPGPVAATPLAAVPVATATAADVPVRRPLSPFGRLPATSPTPEAAATSRRDPRTAAVIYSPSPTEATTIFPNDTKVDTSPKATKPEVAPLHDTIVKELMDRRIPLQDESGAPLDLKTATQKIAEYDTANGIMTKAQESIAKDTIQKINSGRNPAIAGYYKVKPKYDSILENINSKPMEQRNGVDDAFLLNAAAGIENSDRAPTQNDYREMLRASGYRGDLEVAAERLFGVGNVWCVEGHD